MRNHLLEKARQQAETTGLSIRAAALLRIARVEADGDHSQARQTLLEGLDAVQKLTPSVREYLLAEARAVAAAVSPELLATMPVAEREGPEQFASLQSVQLIQTMLTHGHIDDAFDYVIRQNDPESFPFFSVGAVLHRLDSHHPESATRRIGLLRHAVELWRRSLSNPTHQMRGLFRGHHHGFVGLFGHSGKTFRRRRLSRSLGP